MIIDNLNNTEIYEALHPLFRQAFEYIKSTDFAKADTGKTEIQGKHLFVMVSDTPLKDIDDAKPEIHNEYIDIQLPINMAETFGWIDRAELNNEAAPFNTEKDIQFYNNKPTSYVTVAPGNFIIFYPQDGHAPCIGTGSVRKVVVKVKI